MEVIIEVLMKFTFIEMPGPLRERGFHVLDAINVQPNITYLTKIRNVEPSKKLTV